jgi:hypothetical protein
MPAYRGQYLLKNPFRGSATLQRARAGFQGAKEMQQRQQNLFKGALEAGAKSRSTYLNQIMPKHVAEKAEAERVIGIHGFAKAHQDIRTNELQRRTAAAGHEKWGKLTENAPEFVGESEYAGRMHAGKIRGEENKLALAAETRNIFFGGNEFEGKADVLSDVEQKRKAWKQQHHGVYGHVRKAMPRFRRQVGAQGYQDFMESRGKIERAFSPGQSFGVLRGRFGPNTGYASTSQGLFERGTALATQESEGPTSLWKRDFTAQEKDRTLAGRGSNFEQRYGFSLN